MLRIAQWRRSVWSMPGGVGCRQLSARDPDLACSGGHGIHNAGRARSRGWRRRHPGRANAQGIRDRELGMARPTTQSQMAALKAY